MKQRWPLAFAEVAAALALGYMRAACERVEVAGSIRRGRQDVGDVELLCIPRALQSHDLLGQPVSSTCLLTERCRELVATGVLDYRRNAQGQPRLYAKVRKSKKTG